MRRTLTVLGAPSNIGARPYEDGLARDLNQAPAVLRERGLITRLGAVDIGDVAAPPYADFTPPLRRVRNQKEVIAYSRALAARVSSAMAQHRFAIVIGGDCSIVLACLMAARKKAGDGLGLVYVDAHADFAIDEQALSGAVAGMTLAVATGRNQTLSARLGGDPSLVDEHRTALLGRRDADGESPLAASPILDLPNAQVRRDDWLELAALTLEQVDRPDGRGFWIQIDADVLNAAVMPAVESPHSGGLTPRELVRLLTPIVRHPKALGLSLTSYDPALDADRSCARQLIGILESLLEPTPIVDMRVPA